MKSLGKQFSRIGGVALLGVTAMGCAKDMHADPKVPMEGAVASLPKSPFEGQDVCTQEGNAVVCNGRVNLETNAYNLEMAAVEHRIRELKLLCSADFEKATGIIKTVFENEYIDTKGACEASAARLGLLDAAEVSRRHGRNVDGLVQQQERRADAREDRTRRIRYQDDMHEERMADRQSARVNRTAGMLMQLEMLDQYRRKMDERQERYEQERIERNRRYDQWRQQGPYMQYPYRLPQYQQYPQYQQPLAPAPQLQPQPQPQPQEKRVAPAPAKPKPKAPAQQPKQLDPCVEPGKPKPATP